MSPAVKIILIIVAVLVLLGIIGAAAMSYFAYKVTNSVKVDESGQVTSVETPWGKVTADNDAAKVAGNLGVEVYPGAKGMEGASGGSFGDISFGSAEFETSDSLEKVAEFYKSKYTKGTWAANSENDFSMLIGSDNAMITISAERVDEKTIIRIGKTTAATTGQSSGSEE